MRFAASQERDKWRDRGLAALFVIGLWLLLAGFFDFYYDLNDDTAMKDILSGTYTGMPSGHNIQMLYPLGWGISLFYRALPEIPWYGIVLCGCQFLALWTAVYGFCGYAEKRERRTAGFLLLTMAAGILFLHEFVFIQYTVTAGLLACAALVRLCTGPDGAQEGFVRHHIVTAALIVLAFYVRTEMLLLLSPFLGLAVLFRIGREWTDASKDDTDVRKVRARSAGGYGIVIGAAAAFMALGLAADSAAYGSGEWREFRQFFDDRTLVYDFYGLPPYEKHEEFYTSAGLSRAQYTLLENYNFDLDEEIDAETMHKIAQYAASHQEKGIARRLYESVYAYGYRFTHGEELIFDLFIVFSYFFLIKAAMAGRQPRLLGKLALLFGTRTALWLYLLYRGRVVERVTHPLYLMELAMLGFFFLADADALQWKKFEKWAILSLYAILFLCTAISHIQAVREQYAYREEINMQWQAWKDYCRERQDRFYLLDVYSSVAYSEKLFSDTSPAYRNFDLPGGWCVKSPIAQEKRERAGFASAGEAVLAGEAFFAADNTKEERAPDFLIPYYREKGVEILIQEADRCGNISVYRVTEVSPAREGNNAGAAGRGRPL